MRNINLEIHDDNSTYKFLIGVCDAMTIGEFKRLVLQKVGVKPFFLEYDLANDCKFKELEALGSTVKIFYSINSFSLDLNDVKTEESYRIDGIRADSKVKDLFAKIR